LSHSIFRTRDQQPLSFGLLPSVAKDKFWIRLGSKIDQVEKGRKISGLTSNRPFVRLTSKNSVNSTRLKDQVWGVGSRVKRVRLVMAAFHGFVASE